MRKGLTWRIRELKQLVLGVLSIITPARIFLGVLLALIQLLPPLLSSPTLPVEWPGTRDGQEAPHRLGPSDARRGFRASGALEKLLLGTRRGKKHKQFQGYPPTVLGFIIGGFIWDIPILSFAYVHFRGL